jgi:hypothetical protein
MITPTDTYYHPGKPTLKLFLRGGIDDSIELDVHHVWGSYSGVDAVSGLVRSLSDKKALPLLGDVAWVEGFQRWWRSRPFLTRNLSLPASMAIARYVRSHL